jgi:hypothetical protein
VPELGDRRSRLHDFIACVLQPFHVLEQDDPAAPGDGGGEVFVLGRRSTVPEEHVHRDYRGAELGQPPD